MAHDIFLSYSSRDKPVADGVCAHLEGAGIRVWFAPRDIVPGTNWGEAIIDAINASRLMVIVFSSSSNRSPQVLREVERAVAKGMGVIPFRVEAVTPSKSMEYFLSSPHWLDAIDPPLEKHIHSLLETVRTLLQLNAKALPGRTEPARSTGSSASAPAGDQERTDGSLDGWYRPPQAGIVGRFISLFDDK
jgi:hypothetical protein